jgi:7-carboxy-7-deazaguanine synthase
MKTIENFVSWQGEGNDTGKRMLILRFKSCNRACRWCDTSVKMRISLETEISIQEIQDVINNEKCGLMITGGEPTFNKNLEETIKLINEINCPIFNVETNGCNLIDLIDRVDKNKNVTYSLSPKIFTKEDYDYYTTLVNKIKDNKNVIIKLVYENRYPVDLFLEYLTIKIDFDNQRIFLMPEGTTREEILSHAPMVFDAAEKYKVNFSSREHIIYGFV